MGILDSGIEADHPDLAANIEPAQSVSCVDKGVPNVRKLAPLAHKANERRQSIERSQWSFRRKRGIESILSFK